MQIQAQIAAQSATFKAEIVALKKEMIIQTDRDALETRVKIVETEGLEGPGISWMQQQIQQLDPANRSFCFKGLSQQSLATRKIVIEGLLEDVGAKEAIVNLDHVDKIPFDNGQFLRCALSNLSPVILAKVH